MSPTEEDQLDADVPTQALQALQAAHDQAVQAGYPLVVVRNGQLVRVCGDSVTIIKSVPGRKKVSFQGQTATS